MQSEKPIIFLSPSKTMKLSTNKGKTIPMFLEHSKSILTHLQSLDEKAIKDMMKTSDKLTEKTYHMLQNHQAFGQAVTSYSGSVFSNLKPQEINWEENKDNLVIGSALYGLLKPNDSIGHYRLDFTMKFPIQLYEHYQDKVTQYFNEKNRVIINLASNEYSSLINQDKLTCPMITIQFIEADGSIKSTYNKIMRGKFSHHLLTRVTPIKEIFIDQYLFNPKTSSSKLYQYQKIK